MISFITPDTPCHLPLLTRPIRLRMISVEEPTVGSSLSRNGITQDGKTKTSLGSERHTRKSVKNPTPQPPLSRELFLNTTGKRVTINSLWFCVDLHRLKFRTEINNNRDTGTRSITKYTLDWLDSKESTKFVCFSCPFPLCEFLVVSR